MKEAWHQVCRHIWQYLPKNFEAEKDYNRWVSLVKPHCVVCMIFKPFVVSSFHMVCSSHGILNKVFPNVKVQRIPYRKWGDFVRTSN